MQLAQSGSGCAQLDTVLRTGEPEPFCALSALSARDPCHGLRPTFLRVDATRTMQRRCAPGRYRCAQFGRYPRSARDPNFRLWASGDSLAGYEMRIALQELVDD